MSEVAKPLPDIDDPVTAGFWAAANEEELVVTHCPNCGYTWWPPEPVCPQCLRPAPEWEQIRTTGELWSYAIYRRALDPAFADEIPYAVALVELDRGIKMYGIVDGDIDRLEIGQSMTAVFDHVTDELTFVRWRAESA